MTARKVLKRIRKHTMSLSMNQTFYLLCIFGGAVFSGFVILLSTVPYETEENNSEYYLELDSNIIHITTDQGKVYDVHPDSLEEFIEKDNL